jgi:hypothetical protein
MATPTASIVFRRIAVAVAIVTAAVAVGSVAGSASPHERLGTDVYFSHDQGTVTITMSASEAREATGVDYTQPDPWAVQEMNDRLSDKPQYESIRPSLPRSALINRSVSGGLSWNVEVRPDIRIEALGNRSPGKPGDKVKIIAVIRNNGPAGEYDIDLDGVKHEPINHDIDLEYEPNNKKYGGHIADWTAHFDKGERRVIVRSFEVKEEYYDIDQVKLSIGNAHRNTSVDLKGKKGLRKGQTSRTLKVSQGMIGYITGTDPSDPSVLPRDLTRAIYDTPSVSSITPGGSYWLLEKNLAEQSIKINGFRTTNTDTDDGTRLKIKPQIKDDFPRPNELYRTELVDEYGDVITSTTNRQDWDGETSISVPYDKLESGRYWISVGDAHASIVVNAEDKLVYYSGDPGHYKAVSMTPDGVAYLTGVDTSNPDSSTIDELNRAIADDPRYESISPIPGSASWRVIINIDPENDDLIIDIIETNSPIAAGDTLTVDTQITNTGGVGEWQDVVLEDQNGNTLSEKRVWIGPAQSETVTLSLDTDERHVGMSGVRVKITESHASTDVSINEEPGPSITTFDITDAGRADEDGPIAVYHTVQTTVKIENTGTASKSVLVMLKDANGDKLVQRDVTVLSGETVFPTLSFTTDTSMDVSELTAHIDSSSDTVSLDACPMDGPDPDNDNLDTCSENVVYGTDPNKYDTDGDGYLDSEEVRDSVLPDSNPRRSDIYVEVDYRGTTAAKVRDALTQVQDAFADAPVSNPNGEDGINLHILVDDELPESANISNLHTVSVRQETSRQYRDYRQEGYIYMAVDPNHEKVRSSASYGRGIVLAGGDLDTESEKTLFASTFMHELGHTRGLGVGTYKGIDSRKVSFDRYSSIMNYNAGPEYMDYSSQAPHDDWEDVQVGYTPLRGGYGCDPSGHWCPDDGESKVPDS